MRRMLLIIAVVIALTLWLRQGPQSTDVVPVMQAAGPGEAVPALPEDPWSGGERAARSDRHEQPVPARSDDDSNCIPGALPQDEEAFERMLDSIEPSLSSLAASGDPDHELAAAVIAHQRGGPASFVAMMEAGHPQREAALWSQLGHCAQATERTGVCSNSRLTDYADRLAGDNAELWHTLAGYAYREGDHGQALRALQRAVAAPEFRHYWPQAIRIFERALQTPGTLSFNERITVAMALAAAGPPQFTLVDACRQEADSAPAWLEACTALGRRLEEEGMALLPQRLGLLLQREMASVAGDAHGRDAAAARLEATQEQVALISFVEPYLLAHESLFASYLDRWFTGGESEALEFAREEIERQNLKPLCMNQLAGREGEGAPAPGLFRVSD